MKHLWRQLAIATNWPVLVAVAVLAGLGILSIWATAPDDASKQAMFLLAGVGALIVTQALSYQRIGRWAWAFYGLSLLPVLYTVAAAKGVALPFTRDIKGTYAWLSFTWFSIQPAELTKLAFILVLARYLRFRSNYRDLSGLFPPFALAFIPLGLILQQPDLGMALTLLPALFAMLFVAGAKIRHLLAIVTVAIVLAPILWFCGEDAKQPNCPVCSHVPALRHLPQFVKHYQRARVQAMFSRDPQVLQIAGYQQERALEALGSGGLAGKGAGVIPAGRRVPESHNDMVFALIGEQFGFFGSAVVLGAYLVLFLAGIEIASNTREPFGRLIAVGIVACLAGQTFLNLGVVLRLLPVTGVTLPFISYGGSSLLSSFLAVGLLLNVGQNRPLVMARSSFEFD